MPDRVRTRATWAPAGILRSVFPWLPPSWLSPDALAQLFGDGRHVCRLGEVQIEPGCCGPVQVRVVTVPGDRSQDRWPVRVLRPEPQPEFVPVHARHVDV